MIQLRQILALIQAITLHVMSKITTSQIAPYEMGRDTYKSPFTRYMYAPMNDQSTRDTDHSNTSCIGTRNRGHDDGQGK